LSIRAVNALSHYTDWTIGHVHSGALGWNGFMAAGMFYWLAPRLWNTTLWSRSLANMHFWIGLVGILLYVASMWVAGIMQGLMLSELNDGGATLKYAFVDTLKAIQIPYILRSFGGGLYLIGFLLCAINLWKTARSGNTQPVRAEVTLLEREKKERMTLGEAFSADPVIYFMLGLVFTLLWFFLPPHADKAAFAVMVLLVAKGVSVFRANSHGWAHYFDRLLENHLPFTVMIFVAVAIGGVVQIIPSLMVNRAANIEDRLQIPYTPLELAGRDLYVSEGCYNCHSQMIRTLVPDVLRYGPRRDQGYSRMGESLYDFPYQWGSKRTGPDLAREGGPLVAGSKVMRAGPRDNVWHFNHFINPRISPGSNMPCYSFLAEAKTDFKSLPGRIEVQTTLGVPWPAMTKDAIEQGAREQALEIATSLVAGKAFLPDKPTLAGDSLRNHLAESQLIALIAYVQKLGAYEEIGAPAKLRPLDPDSRLRVAAPASPANPASATLVPQKP
jgi:cytochrome c oxidase cbb3-type subunit I/II